MRRILLGGMGMLCALLAAPSAQASQGTCAPAVARSQVAQWMERIAAAPSVDAARELATQPTRGAHFALVQARRVAPWSDSLRSAEEQLEAYASRVAAAPTPESVAGELGSLMKIPSATGALHADVGGSCDYSTGEIFAIVLGFILGILPGIILMFLLC